MEQPADIFIELEAHPFELPGSIYPAGGTHGVAGHAQMHWFVSPYERLSPFASFKASQRATVTQQRELGHHRRSRQPPGVQLAVYDVAYCRVLRGEECAFA